MASKEGTSSGHHDEHHDHDHEQGHAHDHLHRAPYTKERAEFVSKYSGSCFCGEVLFDVSDDPVDASYCHCRDCQRLHGASYQWAAILPKDAVHFKQGTDKLRFYNCHEKLNEYKLPCKIYCSVCHSPLADEGRNMMLVMPVAMRFPKNKIPDSFRATHHMFYGSRVEDVHDDIPKFLGKKGDMPYEEKE